MSVPAARWLETHAPTAQVVMRCREVADLLAACSEGLGGGLLPCLFADLDPALVRLTPEELVSVKMALVYRKEVLLAAPVKAVVELVTEVLGKKI